LVGGSSGRVNGGISKRGLWGPQLLFYLVFGDLGGQKNDISKSTIQFYAFSFLMKIKCLPLNAYFQKVIS